MYNSLMDVTKAVFLLTWYTFSRSVVADSSAGSRRIGAHLGRR